MKEEKLVELLKRIGLYIIGIIFFLGCVNGFIGESTKLYSLIQQQKEEQMDKTVQSKAVSLSLFGRMTYYALLEDGAWENLINNNSPRAYAEISKGEFDKLKAGDTVEGTLTGGSFSNEDIRSAIFTHLILMGIAIIYPICFILYQLIHIPAVESWADRHGKFLGPLFSGILIGGLCIGILVSYTFMGKDIINTIQAHSGNQLEATAVITDWEADYGYRRYERDYYYLALTFEDSQGNVIHMTKEVPPSVYNNAGSSIIVVYPEGHPYRVHFLDDFKLSDTLFYFEVLSLYGITIILTLLLIYAAFLMRRKRKTGSYWPEKEKKAK